MDMKCIGLTKDRYLARSLIRFLSTYYKWSTLPRVINETLLQKIISDYETLIENTKDDKFKQVLQSRVDELKRCPIFRKGQNYEDQ